MYKLIIFFVLCFIILQLLWSWAAKDLSKILDLPSRKSDDDDDDPPTIVVIA